MRSIPKWVLWALIMTATAAAFFGCGKRRPFDALEPLNGKQIVRVEFYVDHRAWWDSPWQRPSDGLDFPRWVVVALDGTGCVAPGRDANREWQPAETYPCPGRWLVPRASR